jgi:hypothetical protein
MKFGDAFTYVFQDPDWFKKIIIPGLIGMLLPVIGQMVLLGWSLKVTLNVIRNDPSPLPEMDFGADLGRGFKAWVVALVYAIPMIIFYIPIMIAAILSGNANDSNSMMAVVAITSTCFGLLMMLYGIVMTLVLPAAYARVAINDSIGSGLAFGEVIGMVRKNFMPYLLVFVGSIAAGFISSLGSIACVIGVFLTVPYSMAILGHLYGQAYMEARNLQSI